MTVKTMKTFIVIGLVIDIIGMIGLGLVAYVTNDLVFIFISAFLRLVTGIVKIH